MSGPYGSVEAFCLFVGYPRSGHSLVGSLLDAHPEVSVAHEANALKLVAVDGLGRQELFDELLRNAQEQAERKGGRRASGYSYSVPGQWQGQVRTLRVIGDKSGQKAASRISRDSGALPQFARVVRVPLRLVHVVRNPYDMVARMALIRSDKGDGPDEAMSRSISTLRRLARATDELIAGGAYPVLTVRHESFVREPEAGLQAICEFLSVETDPGYLEACAAIVNRTPHETRHLVSWSERDLEAVAELAARHAFLGDDASSGGRARAVI